jgi:hypothetical protein
MRIGPAVLVGCIGLASRVAVPGQNQPAPREPVAAVAKPAGPLTPYLIPANSCKNCHDKAVEAPNVPDRICRLTEYKFWDTLDKHKIAYKVLTQPRAQQMGKLLQIDVTKSASCTNCHGTSVPGAQELEPFSREENGVSCIACHGSYIEWVKDHPYPKVSNWRTNDRQKKEKLYGMTDLWNPMTRAAKCASCHIGNATEMKVVTHAMYAAGHPPLPSFETATFSEAQPQHWQYLREKSKLVQTELGYNSGKREQTELVVASGIVALREAMRLYAAEARDPSVVKEPESHWPDFARFDCYACHHDLKVPSWRQARGFASRPPGRPPTPAWPEVLVQLGITVADPDGSKGRLSDYQHALAAYRSATTAGPFGDRQRGIAAAEALADWADAVSQDLSAIFENPKRVAVDGPMALRLLHQLGQMAATQPLDYDSARQAAWAFKIIYDETSLIDPNAPRDTEMDRLIKSLFETAKLPLPGAKTQVMIVESLQDRLHAVAEFDPDSFRAHFTELARRLPPL